jgi:hypothetical protein
MHPKKPFQLALYYALPFVLIVTSLFLFLLVWERRNLAEEQQEHLTHTAAALLQQIIITRLWNAEHGGVYVPVDAGTQPNPYLEDRERDIVSRSGKRYTKINPAYMTRQIAALASDHLGYRFNITSLRPLNPANRPDPWEATALKSFERGAAVQMSVVRTPGNAVFRYMVPLPTEASCLKCHAKQHYQVGDIRGGISVSIPMNESERIYGRRGRTYLAAGTILWLSIMVFILLVSYTLSRKVVAEMTREIELGRLKTAVEMAGAAAHSIRQPLTALTAYFELLKMKFAHDPELVKDLDVMALQCRRIDGMINRMLNLTEYRTTTYVDDIKIADIGEDPPEHAP